MDRQTLYFTVANFPYTRIKLSKSQNSNETRRIWATLAAPVVANSGKKTCDFLMWIQKCIDLHLDRQTLCFTVANFQHVFILVKKIAKLQRESPILSDLLRLPSSPIVKKKMWFPYVKWPFTKNKTLLKTVFILTATVKNKTKFKTVFILTVSEKPLRFMWKIFQQSSFW